MWPFCRLSIARRCGRGREQLQMLPARRGASARFSATAPHSPLPASTAAHTHSHHTHAPPVSPVTPPVPALPKHVTAVDAETVRAAIRQLIGNDSAAAAANAEHCISPQLWPNLLMRMRKEIFRSPASVFSSVSEWSSFLEQARRATETPDLEEQDAEDAEFAAAEPAHPSPPQHPFAAEKGAFFLHTCIPLAARFAELHFASELRDSRTLRRVADLRQPHTWYPKARSMKRRVIFHAGPTNSGKTYHALRALKEAHSGVYCGPLRLLALEIYESMNLDGCPASLMTGQERKEIPFARHTSSTIEMVATDARLDVAVIDEIQMISDPQRGHSWTRALLGLQANEIHVCGDPAAIPVVTSLVEACGDSLEIRNYTRLSRLEVCGESLGEDYGAIRPGDCVVAFSRRDIYTIRRTIERKTAHKCCVVYGQLPPETRSQQARLFNDPASDYKVLVASDAIGMGLNLNIKRIVFHSVEKFNGTAHGPVDPSQMKQIAGRAGRHNSAFPIGYATTLTDDDLPYLASSWGAPSTPITRAGLFPNAEQLQRLAGELPPGTELSRVVDEFVTASQLEGPYFMCRSDELKDVANMLEHLPLTLVQRCALTLMPVNSRNPEVRGYLMKFLEAYCAGGPVRLSLQLPYDNVDYLVRDLESLEGKHQVLDAYMWLAQRLSGGSALFSDLGLAVGMKEQAGRMLEAALNHLSDETKIDWERLVTRRRKAQQRAAQQQGGGSVRGGQGGLQRRSRDTQPRLGGALMDARTAGGGRGVPPAPLSSAPLPSAPQQLLHQQKPPLQRHRDTAHRSSGGRASKPAPSAADALMAASQSTGGWAGGGLRRQIAVGRGVASSVPAAPPPRVDTPLFVPVAAAASAAVQL